MDARDRTENMRPVAPVPVRLAIPIRRLRAFISLARPHQYVKNAFVFLPILFDHRLTDPEALLAGFVTFLAFSMTASSIYIINDIRDLEEDRRHSSKRRRPLASGELAVTDALLFLVVPLTLALFLCLFYLPTNVLMILAGYFFMNCAYSFYFRKVAIIDISCIGAGFVLRIFAGGAAADIAVSHWIVIMTFLLSLFLALGKRRDDLLYEEEGIDRPERKSLSGYNIEFVSFGMAVMVPVIIISYLLYTVSPEVMARHGSDRIYTTALWVVLGIMRYMQVTFVEKKSGSPTSILLKDRFLQFTVVAWLINVYLIIYWGA